MIFLSLFVVSTFDLHKIIFLLNIRIVFTLENFKTLLVVLLGLCFEVVILRTWNQSIIDGTCLNSSISILSLTSTKVELLNS